MLTDKLSRVNWMKLGDNVLDLCQSRRIEHAAMIDFEDLIGEGFELVRVGVALRLTGARGITPLLQHVGGPLAAVSPHAQS